MITVKQNLQQNLDDRARRAQTADRALAVLDAVASTGAGRAAELVERTGLERRVLSRLLASLVAAGMLVRDETATYDLGPRLIELGRLAEQRNRLFSRSRPLMQQLLERTICTTILHRFIDDVLVPELVLTPRDDVSVAYPMGRQIRLHEGVGLCILAALPVEQTADRVSAERISVDRLAAIRESGVAISYGEVIRGVTAVGSPILNERGPIGAVVIAAPEGHHPERFADDVAATAAAVSRRLV